MIFKNFYDSLAFHYKRTKKEDLNGEIIHIVHNLDKKYQFTLLLMFLSQLDNKGRHTSIGEIASFSHFKDREIKMASYKRKLRRIIADLVEFNYVIRINKAEIALNPLIYDAFDDFKDYYRDLFPLNMKK
ncbi:MAG: hypothetical protein GF329_01385 [Candidatus Lokiarchaeota archaeon]|nr:hypothetical protein [Candidatus Lokiarchaeota archaeon]